MIPILVKQGRAGQDGLPGPDGQDGPQVTNIIYQCNKHKIARADVMT